MIVSTRQVQEEFDRIARLSESFSHEGQTYHKHLMRFLPAQSENALEIGCGMGRFTRLLAGRARRVTGIDLSSEMLRLARQHSAHCANIEYLLGDFFDLSLPPASFDCIVTVATLHHLPFAQAMEKMKELLKPGGVLIVHDLVADDSLIDTCMSIVALPVNIALRFFKTGRFFPPKELREAWEEHAKGERYLTMKEVREARERYLPGAQVQRHLLWRYTIVWHKPDASVKP